MIPELELIPKSCTETKRVNMRDLTLERLNSLREGVIDFCRRSHSLCEPMHVWAFFSKIIRGQDEAELWWSYEGDHVNGFLVSRVYPDFDGKWTVYVLMGWTDTSNGKDQFRAIVDDYIRKGVDRIQFVTRRNAKVFQRWAGLRWNPVATTFELRR